MAIVNDELHPVAHNQLRELIEEVIKEQKATNLRMDRMEATFETLRNSMGSEAFDLIQFKKKVKDMLEDLKESFKASDTRAIVKSYANDMLIFDKRITNIEDALEEFSRQSKKYYEDSQKKWNGLKGSMKE